MTWKRYEMWADMDPFGDVGALDDEDVERVFNFINWNPSEYYIEVAWLIYQLEIFFLFW